MVGFYDLDFGEAPPGNYSGACFLILVLLFLGWNCIIMCVYVGAVFLFFTGSVWVLLRFSYSFSYCYFCHRLYSFLLGTVWLRWGYDGAMRMGGNDCGREGMHRGLCILSSIFSSQLFTGGFLGGRVRRGVFFSLPLLWESFFSFLFSRAFLNWEFFSSFLSFLPFFFIIGVLRWRGGFSSGRAMVLTFFFFSIRV